ncbi:MAG: AI-2E family transporter [Eubacteriales bacterium]|nr:AI-2E family transporter [Eubacteriales bacterium]
MKNKEGIDPKESISSEGKNSKTTRRILYFVVFVAFVLIILFAYRFRKQIGKVLKPFFIGLIIVYLVKPPVRYLESRKVPRWIAILIVYIVFLAVLITGIVFFVPEIAKNISELLNTLPDIAGDYEEILNEWLHKMQRSRWPEDIKNGIFNEIWGGISSVSRIVTEFLGKLLDRFVGTIETVFHTILGFVIAFYILKDSEKIKNGFVSMLPRKVRRGVAETLKDINSIISKFIQGQLLTALILGVLETAGLLLVGLNYALFLGLIGGMANFVPYFGPYIGAVPAVVLAFLESPQKALWTVLVFVIAQEIDNDLVSPRIIKSKLGLHPLTTIFVVLAGGQFFGIAGLIFAVPATAILKAIAKRLVNAVV